MIRFDQVGLRYHHAGAAGRGAAGRGAPGPRSEASGEADALQGLDFDIPAGGFRWLTGPSGAGKTSLLKLMYLAIKPSEGNVVVLDTDAGALDRRGVALLRRRIGVVYQDFRLLRHLTAYDNVALPLRLARRPEAQLRADVTELLRWVGLAGRLDHRPEELSGGEQQRVAIARAVVGKPSLLLADEPTGNLDDEQAERLMHLIRSLNALGTTVMVATHNLRLVARHPAPVLELAAGRLVRHG